MSSKFKYRVVIKKDGEIKQEVLDRGEHLCSDIYVVAEQVGTIVSDETLDDEACPPVYDTAGVSNKGS